MKESVIRAIAEYVDPQTGEGFTAEGLRQAARELTELGGWAPTHAARCYFLAADSLDAQDADDLRALAAGDEA